MPAENEAFEDPASQWQFGDWPETTVTQGGGLLQTILIEVSAIRDGAAADRVALAKAISTSFAKVDSELADLRGHVASVRAELDQLRASVTGDVVGALEKQLDALRDAIPGDDVAALAAEIQRLRVLLVGG